MRLPAAAIPSSRPAPRPRLPPGLGSPRWTGAPCTAPSPPAPLVLTVPPPGPVTARGQTRRTVRSHVSAAAHAGHTVPPPPAAPTHQPPAPSPQHVPAHCAPTLRPPPPPTQHRIGCKYPPLPRSPRTHTPPPCPPHPDTCVCFKHGPCAGGCHTCRGVSPPPSTKQAAFDGHWGGAVPPPSSTPTPWGSSSFPPHPHKPCPAPGFPPPPLGLCGVFLEH